MHNKNQDMVFFSPHNYSFYLTLLSACVFTDKDSPYAEFGETLELGLARIDSYRAVASPTYLILKKEDPILSAFHFSHKAESLAFTDPIFKVFLPLLG